ncbi:uncharacterized protein PgNI_02807 [Pyricularia grisea]|uniref:Uncharacterized protein n=1 Tax=Pyricularia grisea TaxID=148305 RepID=A0A6P8BB29_PYRGI|nr:uncharacterized protein PgNI_02807 [Pyricularia grisea]TLD13041.1 hypothetical protein PgNI_02807 [Pyricularia grisea]
MPELGLGSSIDVVGPTTAVHADVLARTRRVWADVHVDGATRLRYHTLFPRLARVFRVPHGRHIVVANPLNTLLGAAVEDGQDPNVLAGSILIVEDDDGLADKDAPVWEQLGGLAPGLAEVGGYAPPHETLVLGAVLLGRVDAPEVAGPLVEEEHRVLLAAGRVFGNLHRSGPLVGAGCEAGEPDVYV